MGMRTLSGCRTKYRGVSGGAKDGRSTLGRRGKVAGGHVWGLPRLLPGREADSRVAVRMAARCPRVALAAVVAVVMVPAAVCALC